jgi:predicted ATP-grasp superfamily ATP-dependent carboligase
VVIGLTEQLIGREELGARGFAWCGNILPLAMQPTERAAVLREVERIAAQLTHHFGLRGVNGIDVVIADGPDGHPRTFLIEVNPRYTASMELIERAYGLNVFTLHVEAMAGRLPDFSLAEHLRLQEADGDIDTDVDVDADATVGRVQCRPQTVGVGAVGLPCALQRTYNGKGIVYARRTVNIPETADWMEQDRRDIPFPGERIEGGHPVCTVLAEGKGREACWNHLLASAEAVRREIGDEVAS